MTGTPIQHTKISSSDIQSAGYDKDSETLEITFTATGTYRYYSVPPTVADGLIKAAKPIIYFLQHIKGRYTWEKAPNE